MSSYNYFKNVHPEQSYDYDDVKNYNPIYDFNDVISYPIRRISRPSRHLYFGFVYTPSCKTDIRKTWEKYGYVSPKRELQNGKL